MASGLSSISVGINASGCVCCTERDFLLPTAIARGFIGRAFGEAGCPCGCYSPHNDDCSTPPSLDTRLRLAPVFCRSGRGADVLQTASSTLRNTGYF